MERISELPISRLNVLISSHLDALINFSQSIRDVNVNGCKFYDVLTNIKLKFDEKKTNETSYEKFILSALGSLQTLEPDFSDKFDSFVSMMLCTIFAGDDFLKQMCQNETLIKNIFERNFFKKLSTSNSDVYLLINQHLQMTEKIEYNLIHSISQTCVKQYNLEDLFSITGKIKRGNKTVTEARAIRDAFAHSHYIITEHFDIEFQNITSGYNFKRKYTAEEFIQYAKKQQDLYAIFIIIMHLLYLNSLLSKYSEMLTSEKNS